MQQGGVLLRTPAPPPIGSGVHLTLRFPDGSDVVLVGDVLDVRDAEGVVVRFRVASPILSQLQSRAQVEQRGEPSMPAARPARPMARGSTVPDALEPSAELEYRFGERVALDAGLRTSIARYPVGTRFHYLPYLDVKIGF